jgi:hypothetical protein
MKFEEFCQIIQPPETPVENGETEEWGRVEKAIGTRLPNDYKNYINVFGTGCLANFLWVFNPFTRNTNLNLLNQVTVQLNAITTLEEEFGEKSPYQVYPTPGGLLPWGITDNGDVLFWLTNDEPDYWNVVICSARGREYEEFEATIIDFLHRLIFEAVSSEIIPNKLLNRSHLFSVINL